MPTGVSNSDTHLKMAIDKIFVFESTRVRQREAPLLKEREQFLSHMLQQDTSVRRVRSMATMLIHVINLMKLDIMRQVSIEELHQASLNWITDARTTNRNGMAKSDTLFIYVASKWFKFHHCLLPSKVRVEPDDSYIEQFVHFMEVVRGMSPATIRAHRLRTIAFLKWNTSCGQTLKDISLNEVDRYLTSKLNAGHRPRSMASVCAALRLFFRFAEMSGWNDSRIAVGIDSPRVPRYDPAPKGPAWGEVRRLLDHDFGRNRADIRAVAIISLCAIYALRSCEIVRLKLTDFDWRSEILTIQRAKSGRIQQFPIQNEVGEKIISYLQQSRPRCKCRSLFVSLKPPYRPLDPTILWVIVASRMKALGIKSMNFGTHSLRHTCATQLLHTGTSLPGIAEFLGHRDLKSVSIYAKHDFDSFKDVANFSLKEIL